MRSSQRFPRPWTWLGGTVVAVVVGSGLLAGCGAGPALAAAPRSAPLVALAASSAWKQAAPARGAKRNDMIFAISCADAAHCWAVGDHGQGSNTLSLVEAYQGTRWAVQSSPNVSNSVTGFYQDELYGIACPSATDCWAVGDYYENSPGEIPLIEHYDGSAWSIVTGPTNAALNFSGATLDGISCLSSNDCWAVGEGSDTLVEQYNGSTWSIVPSAQAGNPGTDRLSAVTCSSADACWAVGTQDYSDTYAGAITGQPLIESYNGASWTVVASPSLRTQTQNQLLGVSCRSANSCSAVGSLGLLYRKKHTIYSSEPLIEQLSAGTWRVAQDQVPSGGYLGGISCPTSSSCWAAGGDNAEKGMVESLSGSHWVAKTGVARLGLNTVACLSSSDCWAVGPASGQPAPSNSSTTFVHN